MFFGIFTNNFNTQIFSTIKQIVEESKDLPPFLIQLLVDKYTSIRSRDYLKRIKAKALNSLRDLSTRNSIKALKAASRDEVLQTIA